MEADSQSDDISIVSQNPGPHSQDRLPPTDELVAELQKKVEEHEGTIKLMQVQLQVQEEKMNKYDRVLQVLTKELSQLKLKAGLNSLSFQPDDENLSIAEMAKRAAEQTLQEIEKNQATQPQPQQSQPAQSSSFQYDESSGLYYDPNSGYYYDQNSGLYYNGHTKTYYKYDTETNNLVFHSQITDETSSPMSVDSNEESSKSKKKKSQKTEPGDVEEGELTDGDSDSSSGSSVVSCSPNHEVEEYKSDSNTYEIVQPSRRKKKNKKRNACVRGIVLQSEVPSLNRGFLFIVTLTGGIIGKDPNNEIYLEDPKVSNDHAAIQFNYKLNQYFIKDLGSKTGTFLNQTKLVKGEEVELLHGSHCQIGGTTLLIHIHPGLLTCEKCEPGLVAKSNEADTSSSTSSNTNPPMSAKDKEKLRKKELNKLRKKYGISGNVERLANLPATYEDKAQTRRITEGSDNPYEKTDTCSTSMDSAIPETNKGHKMLSKMGWKSGEALGQSQEGLREPIKVELRSQRSGLGSSGAQSNFTPFPPSARGGSGGRGANDGGDNSDKLISGRNRAEMMAKTHKRFKECDNNPPKS